MKTMQLPKFDSVDEIQLNLMESLLHDGKMVNARLMKTLEIHPSGFILKHPRARYIKNQARKWSLPLAIGEFAWHLSASNDVNFIGYYAKQWKAFSEDEKTISDSCYGHKIFKSNDKGKSQWNNIVSLLKEDPDTRRAVLSLYDTSNEFGPFSKDVSCICTIHFLIRDGRLDAITHMRSNDIILGLPYDIFLVTMLQEYLATILSVELGDYYHFANSMHLYERHFDLAQDILNSSNFEVVEMAPMKDLDNIPLFLNIEAAIRLGENPVNFEDKLGSYWGYLMSVLQEYQTKKHKVDESHIISASA